MFGSVVNEKATTPFDDYKIYTVAHYEAQPEVKCA